MIAYSSTEQIKFDEHYLGLVDYTQALEIQEQLHAKVMDQSQSSLVLGLEHPSTVTLGKRADLATDLVPGCPFPVVQTDRGGQATLHSPGQLVIYPIFELARFALGVRAFVDLLQEATRLSLLQYGIHSTTGDSPGLFTKRGKIAFIGLRVNRGITSHGLAINLRNDLAAFAHIRPCGVRAAPLDRVCDERVDVDPRTFFATWILQMRGLIC